MSKKIRVAVAGVGNCASALVQGVIKSKEDGDLEGLSFTELGGYRPSDIEFVAAFDVNKSKVGLDLGEAIFSPPNNTLQIVSPRKLGVAVSRAPVLDGLGKYLSRMVEVSDQPEVDVAQTLRDSGAEVLINYVPVGSERAARFYAEQALKAGVAFINAMPTFIVSDPAWDRRFREKGLPAIGDDVMSQLGSTVLHKTLARLMVDRGVTLLRTYQVNIGGDTDFANMLEESRLKTKRESKTSAVQSLVPYPVPTRIGPSDYIEFLENRKYAYIVLEGKYFGGAPIRIELKLEVWDAYNSAGVMIDAVRAAKIGLERRVGGAITSASAWTMKHPPVQLPYSEAKKQFMEFIEGKRER
ncbi:MAG TPA: inositol-3-phosphate synthase [bacterium]|nr:inositol-3-phosphate synthase [bacterium]